MYKPIIILVAPQMGENIGAAARVMKNFGVTNLRIVAPRDGWPNLKARAMAVGAVDIVDRAEIFENLKDATFDLEYLFATTAAERDMNKPIVFSSNLKSEYPYDCSKVGIMFGRENCGLNNEEITLANKILSIGTSDFTSLNLAQAIAIICYECFSKLEQKKIDKKQELATKLEIDYLFQHLFMELDQRGFFKIKEKRPIMSQNIINIFNRIESFSKTEVQTLRGIISALTRELQ